MAQDVRRVGIVGFGSLGPVRDLCPLAPNNVNTMAAASIIASNLGFDNVIGCLVADPRLSFCHIVEIEVTGPGSYDNHFSVHTVRSNPASI
ncbi:LOW QUALITY PROTEIN: putative L-aspartate dehydrogenase [Gigantopelta aegis]|uniref:LOW QUALITY PROTEIN: putative L-aspartate dehydrogenase n=1 Tax=Gigantopelta aegis TaxID=1735272 RepID=UPI001B88CAB7|nr:LOW QUALITY PROTEIN: putative L-aspartate dehydrogenase [Gigantopelta aegis]